MSFLLCTGFSVRPSFCEVYVSNDEVIFSIKVPGARRVFLVGDFNNWNPTVEMMQKRGDKFTSALFLVTGDYRYKFVVDGKWTADPDDASADPKMGSMLRLAEQGGMLILRRSEMNKKAGEILLMPSARYTGRIMEDEGDELSSQEIDLYLHVDEKIASAWVALKTRDNSWTSSHFDPQIHFDRGNLQLKIANGIVSGFENDSIWDSTDPFHLFSNVGIFNRNFGYGRRGIYLDQEILKLKIRAIYSDRFEEGSPPPARIDGSSITAFASSNKSTTILYERSQLLDGEDVFGWELFLDVNGIKLGYAGRKNRGMNRGIAAALSKTGQEISAEVFGTREYWRASDFWAGLVLPRGFSGIIGAGWSSAFIKRSAGDSMTVDPNRGVSIPIGSRLPGARMKFQKSLLFKAGLERGGAGPVDIAIGYNWAKFEYMGPVFDDARALINTGYMDMKWNRTSWRVSARFRYVNQEYGGTPDDFHYYTHRGNFWLDYEDKLDVEDIVGFDMENYAALGLSAVRMRNAGGSDSYSELFSRKPPVLLKMGGLVDPSAGGGVRYVFARTAVEKYLGDHAYFQIDSRASYYPREDWNSRKSFISTYVEAGWRTRYMELSLGFGFDPVVFDRASNDYADIGRKEMLRGAVAGADRRRALAQEVNNDPGAPSDLGAMKYNLLQIERRLQRINTLKFEWIVVF